MPEGIGKSEVRYQRISPLAHVMAQGRFGADKGEAGVTLGIRHPVSIVTIIARKGKAGELSALLRQDYEAACPEPGRSIEGRGITLHWCGAEQWYALAEDRSEGLFYRELKTRFEHLASCSDQSHGRVILTVSGEKARNVLAKGMPVDLHPSVFAPGQCAVTQMAHVGVHLAQVGPHEFELSLFRGFAEGFWEWLTQQAEEFGYLVR